MVNKEKIAKEAREILDKFGKTLKEVKTTKQKKEQKESTRKEQEGLTTKKEFKKKILKNAPKSNENYIISEKAKWS